MADQRIIKSNGSVVTARRLSTITTAYSLCTSLPSYHHIIAIYVSTTYLCMYVDDKKRGLVLIVVYYSSYSYYYQKCILVLFCWPFGTL